MQIAFQIGANCTDEDRLLKSLLGNANALLQQGIAVPGPGKYRSLLRQTMTGLNGARPAADTREILLDAIVEHDNIDRIVLCNDNFIAIPKRIFDHGQFYPQAEDKARGFCQLFPQDEISFFLGMRNPVTFLQDVALKAGTDSLRDYLGPLSPLDIRWSDVIARIRKGAPQAAIYTWCNEDTPLIWEDLIRILSDVASGTQISGQFDVAARILTAQGNKALKSAEMPSDRIARHTLIADILNEHADPDALDETIDLAELSGDFITAMSEGYEDDLDVIAQMEGVELILPFA